jgi:hypothetical protein
MFYCVKIQTYYFSIYSRLKLVHVQTLLSRDSVYCLWYCLANRFDYSGCCLSRLTTTRYEPPSPHPHPHGAAPPFSRVVAILPRRRCSAAPPPPSAWLALPHLHLLQMPPDRRKRLARDVGSERREANLFGRCRIAVELERSAALLCRVRIPRRSIIVDTDFTWYMQ